MANPFQPIKPDPFAAVKPDPFPALGQDEESASHEALGGFSISRLTAAEKRKTARSRAGGATRRAAAAAAAPPLPTAQRVALPPSVQHVSAVAVSMARETTPGNSGHLNAAHSEMMTDMFRTTGSLVALPPDVQPADPASQVAVDMWPSLIRDDVYSAIDEKDTTLKHAVNSIVVSTVASAARKSGLILHETGASESEQQPIPSLTATSSGVQQAASRGAGLLPMGYSQTTMSITDKKVMGGVVMNNGAVEHMSRADSSMGSTGAGGGGLASSKPAVQSPTMFRPEKFFAAHTDPLVSLNRSSSTNLDPDAIKAGSTNRSFMGSVAPGSANSPAAQAASSAAALTLQSSRSSKVHENLAIGVVSDDPAAHRKHADNSVVLGERADGSLRILSPVPSLTEPAAPQQQQQQQSTADGAAGAKTKSRGAKSEKTSAKKRKRLEQLESPTAAATDPSLALAAPAVSTSAALMGPPAIPASVAARQLSQTARVAGIDVPLKVKQNGDSREPDKSIFTNTKVIMEQDLVQDPAIYRFLMQAAEGKTELPLKSGDAKVFGEIMESVVGSAAQIDRRPSIIADGADADAMDVDQEASDGAGAGSGRSALDQMVSILNPAFHTPAATLAKLLDTKCAIASEDSVHYLNSLHREADTREFAARIQKRYYEGIETDKQMIASMFDAGIVETVLHMPLRDALRQPEGILTGGFNTDQLKYNFTVRGKHNTRDPYDDAVAAVVKTQSHIFRRLVDAQERYLLSKGLPCFSNREAHLARSPINELPECEIVPRDYLKQFLREYTGTEAQRLGWYFCGNGAACFSRMTDTNRHDMLYTPTVPGNAGLNGQDSKVSSLEEPSAIRSTKRSTNTLSGYMQAIGMDKIVGSAAQSDDASVAAERESDAASSAQAASLFRTPALTAQGKRGVFKSVTNGANRLSSDQEIREKASQFFHPRDVKSKSIDELKRNINTVQSGMKEWSYADGFVGVQFLTPRELQAYDIYRLLPAETRAANPDPRLSVPSLCLACYCVNVLRLHLQHLHQTVLESDLSIHPETRDFVPLNRFQVIFNQPGEYNQSSVLTSGTGAGQNTACRFGDGRDLIVGAFPKYTPASVRLHTYTDFIHAEPEPGLAPQPPLISTRLCLRECGMDFQLS